MDSGKTGNEIEQITKDALNEMFDKQFRQVEDEALHKEEKAKFKPFRINKRDKYKVKK